MIWGLIPTYAGNTRLPLPIMRKFRAHPHVCGEHTCSAGPPMTCMGSSPRMRGTHVCVNLTLELHGLIPTYAGNTHSPAPDGGLEGAHPHVCGEHKNF